MEPALHNLGKRVPIIDLKFFITSLILQRQTGANMVSVLESLSGLVRERLNLAAKSEGPHGAAALFRRPAVLHAAGGGAVAFWVLKPEYIKLLYTDPVGSKFLTYAIISEIDRHPGDPAHFAGATY